MPSLSIVRVLDALERASMELSKQGETDDWVQWGVLVDRLLVEYPGHTASSVPVQTSKYLKQAVAEGYVDREKRGRKSLYRITHDGSVFLLGRRDQLDNNVLPWYEAGVKSGYLSYAVAPTGSPIIIEDREEDGPLRTLHGVEIVEEFMMRVKKRNPGLRSLYLRFE